MKRAFYTLIVLITYLMSCQTTPTPEASDTPTSPIDTIAIALKPKPITYDYDTTQWTDLSLLDSTFVLDMRYATTNNFVKAQLYDCPRCFLRPAVAQAVQAADMVDLSFLIAIAHALCSTSFGRFTQNLATSLTQRKALYTIVEAL